MSRIHVVASPVVTKCKVGIVDHVIDSSDDPQHDSYLNSNGALYWVLNVTTTFQLFTSCQT